MITRTDPMISNTNATLQRYKYNGKELDLMHGLKWYDYGARMYDPILLTWNGIDPLCEDYYPISPYAYCANNPIRFIDPTGMDYWSTDDPDVIYEFFRKYNSTGFINIDYKGWNHTTDAEFLANLVYNDHTNMYYYSHGIVENDEVVCIGKAFNIYTPTTFIAINSLGESLNSNAKNSTIGNNGKFYWHTAKERGFYGNQFVETVKLAQLGKRITSITGSVGLLLSSYELYNGYVLDGGNFQTIGYNTVRATVDVAGGWVGGLTGLKIGAVIGGGIGALPGSVIGGTIGGIAGSLGCSWFGVGIVDTVYGR